MAKQLTIPGLEFTPSLPLKPKACTRERIASLENRVLRLELELTLIRLQLDGDKEHA